MMEKSSADPRFAQITENYKRIRENIAAARRKAVECRAIFTLWR